MTRDGSNDLRGPGALVLTRVFTALAVLVGGLFRGSCADAWPSESWPAATPPEAGLDEGKLEQARDYALTGSGSGCIIRHGKMVMSWGDQGQLYDLKSSTKSFGATVLGVALIDEKVGLDDLAAKFLPSFGTPPQENQRTGWLGRITLRMLATQTAGFEKPGGFGKLLFEPGTRWHYSDGGPNWLADCLTQVYGRDLRELMFDRVFEPIGIGRADLRWRDNAYRPRELGGVARREFGSGISANVNAMARLGYLYLHEGRWKNRQIVSRDFVRLARRATPEVARLPVMEPAGGSDRFGSASAHYGLLWWNNNDGSLKDVPRDAFWSWGLYDSLIVVIPSLDLVAARAGKSWARRRNAAHYDVLEPFLGAISAAAKAGSARRRETIPASELIRDIRWAPASAIVRRAEGSDNWPATWGDDDALYTAYGDGRGFEPFVPEKLSMGLARITGDAAGFVATNLCAPSIEQRGDGRRGQKASGLLMIHGVLYLWARNAGNARLAWSADHGRNWHWADWRFTNGFGCPTFLNFGRNYASARDGFVYVYSPDAETAYEVADCMNLARVPEGRLLDRGAYEFFQRLDATNQPVWTNDIQVRGAVLAHAGRCYRSGITYNTPLRRYLWCVTGPVENPRSCGPLTIYDAPEPWGPWTVAYSTNAWDVSPGESAHFPSKWISSDGRTLHLIFSGNDSFSVRQAQIDLRDDTQVPALQ